MGGDHCGDSIPLLEVCYVSVLFNSILSIIGDEPLLVEDIAKKASCSVITVRKYLIRGQSDGLIKAIPSLSDMRKIKYVRVSKPSTIMVLKTIRAYSEAAPEFRVLIKINPRIVDPKKLRHHASNLRQAARTEREWAQTALNEATSEKKRSEKIHWSNQELAEELLWDSKVALRWYQTRLKRAISYENMATMLIRKARQNATKLQKK